MSMNSWSYTAVALKSGAGFPTSRPSAAHRRERAGLLARTGLGTAAKTARERAAASMLQVVVQTLKHAGQPDVV